MKGTLAIGSLLVFLLVIAVALLAFSDQRDVPTGNEEVDLKKFVSEVEFIEFVESIESGDENYYQTLGGRGGDMMMETMAMDSAAPSVTKSVSSDDYSTTNIQVEGVDEADIVKSDGEFIYVVTGSKVVILDAYPADEMKILSSLEFEGQVNEIYINDDKLVVFGNGIAETPLKEEVPVKEGMEMDVMKSAPMIAEDYYHPRNYDPAVLTYDISDRNNPILENSVILEGNYVNSRMIGDYVYVVSSKYVYAGIEPPIHYVNGVERSVAVTDIYYPTFRDSRYQFTSVSAINLDDGEFDTQTYLLGTSYTMYVSENNIYLTQYQSLSYEDSMNIMIEEVLKELLPAEYVQKLDKIQSQDEYYDKDRAIQDLMDEWMKSMEGEEVGDLEEKGEELAKKAMIKIAKLQGTAIYKVELDGMDIEYVESGFVPGRMLDQFSMDEHEGNLRVATTTGNNWMFGASAETLNHMYVLDEELDIIGGVEDLAEGERIYSSRFMGDMAYMVTFRQVDPLFVVDLSDPKNPEVMGELKITGFSEYLHPYDENHIIGIGKEATEDGRVQGLKVSLFDVSDVLNPIEVAKIVIGDRGTSSDALRDHKAVLFDKERNLLVLPVDLYESTERNSWGEFVWQGAMVLDISPEEIFERGRISHEDYNEIKSARKESNGATRVDDFGNVWKKASSSSSRAGMTDPYRVAWTTDAEGYESVVMDDSDVDRWKSGYLYNLYPNYQKSIKRSLYMDDVLYTISQAKVKANDLNSLDDIGEVNISEVENDNRYYYDEMIAF